MLPHSDSFDRSMIDALDSQSHIVTEREGLLGEITHDIGPTSGTGLVAGEESVNSKSISMKNPGIGSRVYEF